MSKGVMTLEPVRDAGEAPIEIPPEKTALIGRSIDCDVQVRHGSVSKRHARCQHVSGRWLLEDAGSLNGTWIGERRIETREAATLQHGDTIAFGQAVFRVVLPPDLRSTTGTDPYVTRATIFLRLNDSDHNVREVGWREFRDRYAPVIVGFCRNAGLPAQDADDVLQEVMFGFFRVSSRFEYDPRRGRFRGYLKTATLNVIRKRLRQRPFGAPVDSMDLADDAPGVTSLWDRQWEDHLTQRAIETVRGRLDTRTFEAFDLYARRGVPAEEVARRLDMKVNSVHQAKRRVLKAVNEEVARMQEEEG